MWTLVLLWVVGTNLTPLQISNFETKEACGRAFNTLKSDVTWGQGVNLTGQCVASKVTAK